MLGVIRGQVVTDFLTVIDLPDHQLCSREDNVVELRNEAEEIGVESDAGSDAKMEVLDVVICLEHVHVDGKTFWPDFPHPKSNDVAVVEDEELSAGCRILNCSNSLPHSCALNGDLICRQEAQCQIATKNSLHLVVVVIMVITGQTMA